MKTRDIEAMAEQVKVLADKVDSLEEKLSVENRLSIFMPRKRGEVQLGKLRQALIAVQKDVEAIKEKCAAPKEAVQPVTKLPPQPAAKPAPKTPPPNNPGTPVKK